MTRRERARRWIPLLLLPLELGVLVAVVAGVAVPAFLRVATTVIVLAAVGFELVLYGRFYRRHRRAGLDPWPASRAAIGEVLPGPVQSAFRLELGIWRGLVRGVLRRPDIPNGATGFTHHRALAPVRWIVVTVLIIEVGVVHTVVPTGVVRWTLLILGLYSLIWVMGYLLGSGIVRPHLVSARGLILRCGLTTDITVPVDLITHARLARHGLAGTATIQVTGNVLNLVDNGGTNLDIKLTAPLHVTLPRGRSAHVTQIRVWVDNPTAMIECIHRSHSPNVHLQATDTVGDASTPAQP